MPIKARFILSLYIYTENRKGYIEKYKLVYFKHLNNYQSYMSNRSSPPNAAAVLDVLLFWSETGGLKISAELCNQIRLANVTAFIQPPSKYLLI